MLIERLSITAVILLAMGGLWLGWQYYQIRLRQRIQPVEVSEGTPTLLYFSAEYCAPCKFQQAPIVDNLRDKLGEAVVIKKYDVAEHPDLAGQFKILTLPTTVILNPQGQVKHINHGFASQAKLEAQLL